MALLSVVIGIISLLGFIGSLAAAAPAAASAAVAVAFAVSALTSVVAVRSLQSSSHLQSWSFGETKSRIQLWGIFFLHVVMYGCFAVFILQTFELSQSQRESVTAVNSTCIWYETSVGTDDVGKFNWDSTALQLLALYTAFVLTSCGLGWLPLAANCIAFLLHFVINISVVLAMGRECHSIQLGDWVLSHAFIGCLGVVGAFQRERQNRDNFVSAVGAEMDDNSFDANDSALRFLISSSSDIVLLLYHASGALNDPRIGLSNGAAAEVLGKDLSGRSLLSLIDTSIDRGRFGAVLQSTRVNNYTQRVLKSSRSLLNTGAETSMSTIQAVNTTAASQTSARLFYRRSAGLPQRSRSILDEVVVTATEDVGPSLSVDTASATSDQAQGGVKGATVVPMNTTDSFAPALPHNSSSGDFSPALPSAVPKAQQPILRRVGFKTPHRVILDADVFLHVVSETRTIAVLQPSAAVERVHLPAGIGRSQSEGSREGGGSNHAATEATPKRLIGTAEWNSTALLQDLYENDLDEEEEEVQAADASGAVGQVAQGTADPHGGAPPADAAHTGGRGESHGASSGNSTSDEKLVLKKSQLKALLSGQRVMVLEPDRDTARIAMKLLRKNGAVGTLVQDAAGAMAAFRSSLLAARAQHCDFTCMVVDSSVADVEGTIEALRALKFRGPILQLCGDGEPLLAGATAVLRRPVLPHKLANAMVHVIQATANQADKR